MSRFSESLRRVTLQPDFYDRFYVRLFGASEEIGAFFGSRDVPSIISKLRVTLMMVAEAAEGKPGLTMYLEMLGGIHRRLDVAPHFLRLWRDSLVETVAESDAEFNDEIRGAWERTLDQVIKTMYPSNGDT
ncbi:MAG: globin [Pseudomonadota bacterium]